MRRQEQGFTLIELVIVIVILGILAAVAIPQYLDLSTDAKAAAASGGKSSVGSALAIALADKRSPPTVTEVVSKLPGSTCVAGVVRIPANTTDRVSVTLLQAGGAAAGACADSVVAISTAVYSST